MKKAAAGTLVALLSIFLVFSLIACTQPEDITGDWYFTGRDSVHLSPYSNPKFESENSDKLTVYADGTALLINTEYNLTTQYTWSWNRKEKCWVFASEKETATIIIDTNGKLCSTANRSTRRFERID